MSSAPPPATALNEPPSPNRLKFTVGLVREAGRLPPLTAADATVFWHLRLEALLPLLRSKSQVYCAGVNAGGQTARSRQRKNDSATHRSGSVPAGDQVLRRKALERSACTRGFLSSQGRARGRTGPANGRWRDWARGTGHVPDRRGQPDVLTWKSPHPSPDSRGLVRDIPNAGV